MPDTLAISGTVLGEALARGRIHENPMPSLHVVIELKSDPKHPEVKVDLTQEGLQEQFIAPYENGHPIVVNGRAIPLEDIKRLSIHETHKEMVAVAEAIKKAFQS